MPQWYVTSTTICLRSWVQDCFPISSPNIEAFSSILPQAAMSLSLCPKGNRFVSLYPGGLCLLKEELRQRVSCLFPPCPYHWVIPNCMSVLLREVLSAFLHNSHAMEF